MSGCGVVALLTFLLLTTSTSSAPVRESSIRASQRLLDTLVSGDTTGLEVPRNLIAGIGDGSGALQLVVNVHTDSHGNIEVYTN